MLRKITALWIALMLLVSMNLAFAGAAYEKEDDELQSGDFFYIVERDGTVTITGHTSVNKKRQAGGYFAHLPGGQEEVVIPAEIDGRPVTTIGQSAFAYCYKMKSVVLPEGLVDIGPGAFWRCGLESVRLPSTILYIEENAFSMCQQMKEVVFTGESDVAIAGGAFREAGITRFSVPDNSSNLAEFQGVLFDKNEKILLAYPIANEETSYNIPTGIRSIGAYAFYGSALDHLTFPDTLHGIESYAFSNCEQLQEVLLPDSLDTIGDYAFNNCTGLRYLRLGSGLNEIGDSAFSYCSSLQSIYLPADLRSIGSGAFAGCTSLLAFQVSLDSPFFYDSDNVLFAYDRLIAWPAGMQQENYTIPANVKVIEEYAFSGARIRHLMIPGSVESVRAFAISDMPELEELILCEGIRSLTCITGNPKLIEVTLPRSVAEMPDSAPADEWPPVVRVYAGSFAEEYCLGEEIPVQYVNGKGT